MTKPPSHVGLIGALIISCLVMIGFIGVTYAIFSDKVPVANKEQLAAIVFGGWLTLATGVVGYWIGSSLGSMQKTDALQQQKAP